MTHPPADPADSRLEILVGRLLQIGVTVAAVVVLFGGVLYVAGHGHEPTDLATFRASAEPRALKEIGTGAVHLRSRSVIQLGLVLLILTPVARVALMGFAFLRRREYQFVFVTLVVLGVLLFSLFSGYFGT